MIFLRINSELYDLFVATLKHHKKPTQSLKDFIMITGTYKYPKFKHGVGYFKFFLLFLGSVFIVSAFLFAVNAAQSPIGCAALTTGFAIIPVAAFSFPGCTVYNLRRLPKRLTEYRAKISVHFPKAINRKFIYADYGPGANGSPCCLAYDGKNIIIMNQGTYAILGQSDIRGWSYELGGAQNTYGGDRLSNAMNDIEANLKTARNSGLTLQVADIEKPTWFFPTGFNASGKKVCERWMEILKQIDEGSLYIEKTTSL